MAISITNKNVALIHKKEPQFMSLAPFTNSAGVFMLTDVHEENNLVLAMVGLTTHYLYHNDEDAWVQIPSGSFGGTLGAGTCGATAKWSSTITANGGATTNATTVATVNGLARGKVIRFLTGANAGIERTVTDVLITPGGTSSIYFAALPNAVANTDTFIIDTCRFYVWNAGTMSATSYRVYDPLLGTWTSLSVTGAPTAWSVDGRLVSTPSSEVFATGTTTSATTNTLSNSAKNWTANQWTNYQVRIVSGTGIGQIRTIASNTGVQLTVSANWTVTPSTDSVYEITGNDDFLYLLGNGVVTLYRYSISSNTWTALSPGVARSSAPGLGMSANWAPSVDTIGWSTDENNYRNGRYIYSFRGLAVGTLHRYDIALNSWAEIAYNNLTETFSTGTSYALMGRYIYIRKESTGRMFKFSISGNYLEPLTTTLYPESTAVAGDKMWGVKYMENDVTKLQWLYWLGNSTNILHRMLIY